MSDTAGHGQPQLDVDELRHTLTIEDVERELVSAGVPRSHRQITRYCESKLLDAVRIPGPSGLQWYVSPASLPKAIGDLKQWDAQRASRVLPQPDMSNHVAPFEPSKHAIDTPSQGAPGPAMTDQQNKGNDTATEPATLRHGPADLDIYEHPYVKRLEDRVEKIEAKYEAQIRRTEEIQVESQRELMKLQQMIAVGQSQTLADFMLKAKDWLLTSAPQTKSREVNDANSQ